MDPERRSEIWEYEDRDLKIEQFIIEFVNTINQISKSNREHYVNKALRELIGEDKFLEVPYE